MTEYEWINGTAIRPMLQHVQGKLSRRKQGLFAVACCRQISHLFRDQRLHHVLDLAERHAEGSTPPPRWQGLLEIATAAYGEILTSSGFGATKAMAVAAAYAVSCAVEHALNTGNVAHYAASAAAYAATTRAFVAEDDPGSQAARSTLVAQQCVLLRDLVGNPFAPVALAPACRTPAVLGVARTIHEDRDYSLLPLLADALEEAGCTIFSVLHHCRQEPVHVRGCWVIDALLERG